jgi:hypothetical protein
LDGVNYWKPNKGTIESIANQTMTGTNHGENAKSLMLLLNEKQTKIS